MNSPSSRHEVAKAQVGPLAVAIVQVAPIPLAMSAGLEALIEHVRPLADERVGLVAFGESFIGGYPHWFDRAAGAGLWLAPGAKSLHAILLREALFAGDPRLRPLQALVNASGTLVSFGAHERVRGSLFNTQFLIRPHAPPLIHRKLVPTHGERLLWGQGDGSTLGVHDAPWGRLGSLICWEHWMPLTRAAMHHCGETLHIAAWPTVCELHLVASRHYAFEGRSFVLAAAAVQTRADLLDGLERAGGNQDARTLLETIPDEALQQGGSAIIGPDGCVLARAGSGAEILRATVDLTQVERELTTLDVDGHYSRPDIFRLAVDREARVGVADTK